MDKTIECSKLTFDHFVTLEGDGKELTQQLINIKETIKKAPNFIFVIQLKRDSKESELISF